MLRRFCGHDGTGACCVHLQTTWNAPWGDNGVPKALDANDYPTQLQPNQRVTTLMIRDLQGHVPGGIYTVLVGCC